MALLYKKTAEAYASAGFFRPFLTYRSILYHKSIFTRSLVPAKLLISNR